LIIDSQNFFKNPEFYNKLNPRLFQKIGDIKTSKINIGETKSKNLKILDIGLKI